MSEQYRIPELLAPAGSEEALRAALAAGADAVYFGGKNFSNRMRARNFDDDGIRAAIAMIHDAGAKAYITMNTRVRDREADEALALADVILSGDERCDAIICADFGLAAAIRARYPHAVLHASTQTSLASPADCAFLRSLGFTRLVVPRELSMREIAALCQAGFEIEMFAHGAHCVSLSGQCLLSHLIGNRSGNRGACAQPCRLPYRLNDGASYDALSLADMCLAGQIARILPLGVSSLKLEGRLKSPSYVYGVTKIYRSLLDERRNATPQEIRVLESLFTRGFTDGYFVGKYTAMQATATGDDRSRIPVSDINTALTTRLRKAREQKKIAEQAAKIPLHAHFTAKINTPMTLTLSNGDTSVTVGGAVSARADGGATTEDAVLRALGKLGNTAYALDPAAVVLDMDAAVWIPVSTLNAIRREAVEALDAARVTAPAASVATASSNAVPAPICRRPIGDTAEFLDPTVLFRDAALADAVTARFSTVAVPYQDAARAVECFGSACVQAVLPPLTPDAAATDAVFAALREQNVGRVLVHTAGQMRDAALHGLEATLSFRANVTSEASLAVYAADPACAALVLSPELPAAAASAIAKASDLPLAVIAYGKLPAMTLSRCLIAQATPSHRCPHKNRGGRQTLPLPDAANRHRCSCTLTDRKGEAFPVFALGDCETVVCNAHPIWMADKAAEMRHLAHHFLFTDESAADIRAVLRAYDNEETGSGRRLG